MSNNFNSQKFNAPKVNQPEPVVVELGEEVKPPELTMDKYQESEETVYLPNPELTMDEDQKSEEPELNINENQEPVVTEPVDQDLAGNHKVVANCEALYARREPIKGAEVVTTLKKGQSIKVLDSMWDWTEVETENGEVCYCMTQFLE